MLPARHRLTTRDDFAAVRRGRRAGSRTLVVSVAAPSSDGDRATRVGIVVGRVVGNAVVRNRVRRRLRHLMRERVSILPAGSRAVVRAQAPAAGLDSGALGDELDALLARHRRTPRHRR